MRPASPDRSSSRNAGFRLTALGCLLLIALGAGTPDFAWGRSGSGGYSRPSGGFTSGYSAPSRRPSVTSSGGYSRRSYSGSGYTTGSAGDRAMSRGASSRALRDYRAAQRPAETNTRRPPVTGDGGWGAAVDRRPPVWGGGWPGGRTARQTVPGSGILTGVALWAALNALSAPGRAQYFYDHRHDPGYVEWRQEAERRAAEDPAVAAKLAQLDTRLAQMEGRPEASAEARGRAAPGSEEAGSGFIWLAIFVGVAVLALLWFWRRRIGQPGASAPAPGLGGTAATRFRVGMTFPVDPAPFLLAAGLTKVEPPEEGGLISAEAIGVLRDGEVLLHRLYLPGGKAFFQLHLGADGRPDECRYFSLLDEVTPADNQEWAFWLDPAQGMIGWPSFQTKDAKLYGRVWAPGETRIPPHTIAETRQYLDRTEERQMQAMLYGAATGGTPPAPGTEYILVSAIEAAGQAWVEIDVGIDVNPAALTLPSVPLAA